MRQWHETHDEAALIVSEPRRSLDQNSKLWPMLADVAKQVQWHGQYLKDHDWKDVFTAALKRYRAVPGIDGGIVLLGMRTSRMTKGEFSELVELIYSFGAEHGVVWSEPAKRVFEEHKQRRAA
ncbi:MAG: recombination protein NinB [Rhodanobacter sp.]